MKPPLRITLHIDNSILWRIHSLCYVCFSFLWQSNESAFVPSRWRTWREPFVLLAVRPRQVNVWKPASEYESAQVRELGQSTPTCFREPLSLARLRWWAPIARRGEEMLKHDNRKAEKNFRQSGRGLGVSALLRFSDADHNYVWSRCYNNQRRIHSFPKRFEIVLDDDGLEIIRAFFQMT